MLGHMQVCISLQHPTSQFFTGRMPFLPPNQQRQSTEGNIPISYFIVKTNLVFGVGSSPGDHGRGLETEILRSWS